MSDTISRQKAIDALDGEIEVTGKANAKAVLKYTRMVSDRIKALPSAHPEPRWIPCESELPNKYGNYLITTDEGEVDIGSYNPDIPGAWSACDARGFHWVWGVVAWMPLLKPYERSKE